MNKLYETPEILVTRFDIDRTIMADGGNLDPKETWEAGLGGGAESETTTYDNPDLDLFG